VPQAAVNQQQGTYQVTVVGADNRAQLRTVAVGPRVDTLWVITSGLKRENESLRLALRKHETAKW